MNIQKDKGEVKGLTGRVLLLRKFALVASLVKLFPGKLKGKCIVTSAVLSIFVKSLFAGADVRSLGIVTHCIDVTIRWNCVGTLIYI